MTQLSRIHTLFLTIVIGKALSRAVTWTGVGSIDKTFGLLFGFFKGYVISICLFSIFNWFYPYQNWGISVEKAISFDVVKKGSEMLIEEFPSSEDFINTKDTIEKIRTRSHWNISNITAKHPVLLTLCSQEDLENAIIKAGGKIETDEDNSFSTSN